MSCTTANRVSGSTFYARRYTFTLASSGWVSIDLEATGTGTNALDTYLVLLGGHGSGGSPQASDDDSGTGDDAQLADVFLTAGDYTIEATTATNGYRLSLRCSESIQPESM
ncbi:hypothetical protein [Candidatus Poriferisodalis sp.]|uniref:hypothetical protein n=1 Tax=Candidatus Poriferisodalis sp. TaxID=3101277 RepID=UPI003AF9594D